MLLLLLSVALNWTAPGDDGNVGRATFYDVRYATDSLTVANWTSATQATGEPAPQMAGSKETFSMTLASGKWWFAIRTRDDVGNQSALSNIVSRSVQASCTIVVAGDVNASGAVTPGDLVYLANFCFRGLAPPLPCTANGDVNCSGSVTSADIIYLVGYVFQVGAPPCDICRSSPMPCS